MANETRQLWEQLDTECCKCGLPRPYIIPARLGTGKTEVGIGDIFQVSGESVDNGIQQCLYFVAGYRNRMLQEKKATEVSQDDLNPMTKDELWHYACVTSQAVVNSEGLGGPVDHALLAKAMLALCAIHAIDNHVDDEEYGIW